MPNPQNKGNALYSLLKFVVIRIKEYEFVVKTKKARAG